MATVLDIVLVPLAYVYVFGVIALASLWKRNGKIDGSLARKVVHLGIGILVIAAPLLFSDRWFPTSIGLSFIFITYFTSPISPVTKWRLAAFRDGNGLGTVYYSLSLTALLYFFFESGWIIQVGFLPLVFGDAFANIIGIRYGEHKWPGLEKSIEGSIAGGIASFVIVVVSLSLYLLLKLFPGNFLAVLLLGLGAGLIMPLIEIISPFGLDNLSIPFSCTFMALLTNVQLSTACAEILCVF